MKISFSTIALCMGMLAVGLASCSSDENENNASKTGTFSFSAQSAGSKTSFDHTLGTGATFYWEVGDNIFVKDDNNTYQSSSSSNITAKTSKAMFYVGGTFGGNSSYSILYTGKGSTSAEQVTIASAQTQSAANNTEHLGVSGDCGVATATSTGSTNPSYTFTQLEHKAAYLCFLPSATASTASTDYTITQITVSASSVIAGTFGFSDSGISSSSVTNSSTSITLTLTDGFSISNTSIDQSANASYMVILPGTYTSVSVVYTIQNTSTGATSTVSRTISSLTVSENEITRIQHVLSLS